ncbi:hypothetical protein [Saccharopolyspora cebuensis]|uniref:Uncharacterized protein n=1 Tax=Saccharopolyspora cebuensis TaxID=418759 RepID=A0ABV4CPE8_9PSEU
MIDVPPDEFEEAYIEGREDGLDDRRRGTGRNIPVKHGGEVQHWYAQGYLDGFSAEVLACGR